MNKTSQNAWALAELQKNGYVRRNQALKRNITRLAARVADLKEAGHEIVGSRLDNGDYQYSLVVK